MVVSESPPLCCRHRRRDAGWEQGHGFLRLRPGKVKNHGSLQRHSLKTRLSGAWTKRNEQLLYGTTASVNC